MRARDRIHRAEELAEFVRPAGVMDQSIYRERRLAFAVVFARAVRATQLGGKFIAPHLEHLSRAIKYLAAQIRALLRPAAERRPGGRYRIPEVLSRRARVIGNQRLAITTGRRNAAAFA